MVDAHHPNHRAMYRNLLVPVDGTELSEKAMLRSIELARQLGAAITAFIAEPTLPLPAVGRSAAIVMAENEQHDARIAQHAMEVLKVFEARARAAGVAFSGHYRQAPQIPDAIADAATEHHADMIVMATHGRGAFGELMFGSHTKRVMAASRVPLLVLH
jgi:nucleotide-binding universal stress UspA family protein